MRFISRQSDFGPRRGLWLFLLLAGLSLTPAWADGWAGGWVNHKGHKHDQPKGQRHAIRAIRETDYYPVDPKKAALGQAFFFDKELSGNRNISCSTCHSPVTGTSDGLSINLGEGAHGFSVSRDPGRYPPAPTDPLERGQRNAPALFNVGAKDFVFFMHDGRFGFDDSPDGFLSPAGDDLPQQGFDNVLEVVSIFAFTEIQEMLGQVGENDIADSAAARNSPFIGVWDKLVERIKAQPKYRELIFAAYPELYGNIDNFTIAHVGKANAHFQSSAFRTSLDNPFDRFLKGDEEAISKEAAQGYKLFTGKAQCVSCHNGPFLTDQEFHAIGVPQIGPGFGGVGNDSREDFGREGVTHDVRDRYKFRTPSLRNVALTGPWGHDGAFKTLEGIVRHHLDAERSLYNYDPSQRVLPSRADLDALDLIATNNPDTRYQIEQRIELDKINLNDNEFKDLMAFLYALTDPKNVDLRHTVPKSVPSSLTLAD